VVLAGARAVDPAGGGGVRRGRAAACLALLERLLAIAGSRGIDTTKRLTREQAHDRKRLRKSGV